MEVVFASTPYGSGFFWTSHDLLIWTTPRSAEDCDFLPIPPVLHNSSTNTSRTPNSRQQLPDDVELVVTASFLSAGNRLFRSRPPCHSRSISERASMRAGLSRKRGSRLRKEHLRFTAAWDCVTSPPKGSTFQIALPMVPHAGKMPLVGCLTVVSRLFVIPMPLHQ